ncbi:UNVERIFIED_CONTAM: hypothetical protein Sradi_6465300 [Sesamum radiatum]|uniref:Uncharacterized protein n=1 Tax=Sesamum radiatum TaxID=300843 RepID=A0AAW2K7Z0_SESRA
MVVVTSGNSSKGEGKAIEKRCAKMKTSLVKELTEKDERWLKMIAMKKGVGWW